MSESSSNDVKFLLTMKMANEIVELVNVANEANVTENSDCFEDITSLKQYKDAHTDDFSLLASDPEAHTVDVPISMTVLQSTLRANTVLRPTYKLYLHELLNKSQVYTEKASAPKYSPELQKYLKTLRAQQEKQEYKRLVADLPGNKPINTGPLNGVSSVTKDLSIAVNVLTILITGFVVFYYIGRSFFGDNLALSVGCGCVGLIGGLLLETCLLIVRDKQERIVEEREIRREKQRYMK